MAGSLYTGNEKKEMICESGTPVIYYPDLGLYVKHEDLCCPGGPHFSKMRGVETHINARPEKVIGVLDTSHSQGGWAVARACAQLNKRCVVFFPWYKDQLYIPQQQHEAELLGAGLVSLPAGRSAVLYHEAKKELVSFSHGDACYMMPNALKLPESVSETAAEFMRTEIPLDVENILVSASSGTIAAGVLFGVHRRGWKGRVLVHLGYSRSTQALFRYMSAMVGVPVHLLRVEVINEGYSYADKVRDEIELPFPSNDYYDRKAVAWFVRNRHSLKPTLLWNIG